MPRSMCARAGRGPALLSRRRRGPRGRSGSGTRLTAGPAGRVPWGRFPQTPRAGPRGASAMAYDLLIKNGWVVDGSGLPRFRADVGVNDGLISAIGRLRESAKEVIDAEGRVVAPGFVDGHTHMDAQIFW